MPSEAFPASRRVRKRSDFLRIQREGRAFRTAHFVLLVLLGDEASASVPPRPSRPSRLGVVATKKLGHAPARTRGKRICREVFRRSGELIPAGFDCVVLLRAGADEIPYEIAASEWESVRRAVQRHCEEARNQPRKAPTLAVPVERGPGRPHVAGTKAHAKRRDRTP